MLKFQRNYYLEVTNGDGVLTTLSYPLTLDFTVTQNTMGGAQQGDFTVFNVAEGDRKLIAKNRIDQPGSTGNWLVRFFAGYGPTSGLPLVFQGLAMTCNSVREEGSTDWQTNITAFTAFGNLTAQTISISFAKGSKKVDAISKLISLMNNGVPVANQVTLDYDLVGSIFNDNPTFLRDTSFSGSYYYILGQITGGNMSGGNFRFEKQKLNLLLQNESVNNPAVPTLNSSTGLLGYPYIEQTWLYANMLFEPRIQVMQSINLQIQNELFIKDGVNGPKTILGYTHKGTISGSVEGKCETQLQLYAPLNSKGIVIGGADPFNANPGAN